MHGKHRRETDRQLDMWLAVLGSSFDVPSFSRRDWDHFLHIRSVGVVDGRGREVSDPDVRRPVSKRVCAKDLASLRSAFKWATEWRHPASRQFLLDVNPTRGLVLPREKNPRRQVVTFDRFLKLLEVAPRVRVKVGQGKKAKWVRVPLRELLIVAEATGRRIGAIVALRWSDWLPDRGTNGAIRWRADSDKLGREWITPVASEVREALEAWRRECPGLGEAPIFPQTKDPNRSITLYHARDWLQKAEALAGLEHVRGGGWHSFRRKWAMERKGMELRDVAHAGGWTDPTTLLRVYQAPDPEALERVVTERRKLREVAES
ncbi:MAG: tyrosine-type recombinase/integrase [Phycisphaerales bacterium]|nr:MAG: tyrosine-type recombinase/integrase [Phycisphaerales bacterium]